jgi:hypothetical protein
MITDFGGHSDRPGLQSPGRDNRQDSGPYEINGLNKKERYKVFYKIKELYCLHENGAETPRCAPRAGKPRAINRSNVFDSWFASDLRGVESSLTTAEAVGYLLTSAYS